jgi:hypothetical protein
MYIMLFSCNYTITFGSTNLMILTQLLDEKYGSRRRTARDGSSFYRSFIFKYLVTISIHLIALRFSIV